MARTRRSKSQSDISAAAAVERYVCIHGHFYQPPRENPWLETVEEQASASPYHDWNERITAECYSQNGASRILNKQNQIVRISNNYAHMSFNFGPTLLSWLQEFAPLTYRSIFEADKESLQRYSGHGSAMAQVYNHIIMPLADERDALTQIRWGIADFEHRFNRRPEGMWLAETAVNTHVLDLLAQEGIKFTVLAPAQALRTRPITKPGAPEASWSDTPNASVDPTHPYCVRLPEGRSIAVFFYDGPGSRAIAFEGLLNSGEDFGRRLVSGFRQPVYTEGSDKPMPQLAHVATDGESYGHHHKHGDMALAYAMHWIEEKGLARLTNYGEFLSKFPPQYEAQVVENTSWSCAHGIERWRSNCGCNGGRAGWNQLWRTPLRKALDDLRDAIAPMAEKLGNKIFNNVWQTRDAYIRVILNRSAQNELTFLEDFASHELSPAERVTAWELLELLRHGQLMYTSCGWFFDDITGIETVQIIAYAGRVLELARKLFGHDALALEQTFLATMAEAKSNMPDPKDGAEVYHRWVQPLFIDLEHVGAHYAISSIFRPYPEDGSIFCFDVRRLAHEVFTSGRGRLATGRANIVSRITEESEEISFAVLHLGDQNLSAAVCPYTAQSAAAFDTFSSNVRDAMGRADLPEVIRLIDRYFGCTAYSLTSLFRDEQQRILRTILDQTLTQVETSLRNIYEDHSSLLHFLSRSGMPPPSALALAAGFALNASLRLALEAESFDSVQVRSLLNRATEDHIALKESHIAYTAAECMSNAMQRLEKAKVEHHPLEQIQQALDIAETLRLLPCEVDLWQSQNIWNHLAHNGTRHWPIELKEPWLRLGKALNIDVAVIAADPA